jgi:hypothetical protein
MCDCHDLVLLVLKRLLNLGQIDGSAKVGAQLVHLGAIRLEARRGRGQNPSAHVNADYMRTNQRSPRQNILY